MYHFPALRTAHPERYNALTPAQRIEQDLRDAKRELARQQELLEAFDHFTRVASDQGWDVARLRSEAAVNREMGEFAAAAAQTLLAEELERRAARV